MCGPKQLWVQRNEVNKMIMIWFWITLYAVSIVDPISCDYGSPCIRLSVRASVALEVTNRFQFLCIHSMFIRICCYFSDIRVFRLP